MGKLTYILKNDRSGASAHVIVDGTAVHASHPRGEHRLISFATDGDKAALAKFQDVIKQHFHPRDGWVLFEKKPGVAEFPEWPTAPTPEELAAAAAAQHQRRLGYVVEGDLMVLNLEKQRTVSDLEIALDRAGGVAELWVITTSNNEAGPRALFARLHEAAPKLRALFVDCPWETLTRACTTELPGLGAFLEQRRDLLRLGVTGEVHLQKPLVQQELTALALCADPIDAATLEQIARRRTPALKELRLCLSVEGESDEAALSALPSLLAPSLETLTLMGLPRIDDTMAQLLAAGRRLPATVELDGSCEDGAALVAAVTKWKVKAPTSRLALGEHVMDSFDDAATTALTELVGEAFISPFVPEAHDARARALWAKLA